MEQIVNIQLKLDEDQLRSIVENGLRDLPQDELNKVLLDGLTNFIATNAGSLFYSKRESYYGGSYMELSDWAQKVVRDSMQNEFPERAKEIVDTILEKLAGNWETYVKEYIIETFGSMLLTNMNMDRMKAAIRNGCN